MRLNKSAAARFLTGKKGKDTEGELWSYVAGCRDLGLELRRPFEREWIITLAFLSGRQYVFFHSNAHRLVPINKVRGRSRRVDNQMMPHWRRQVSDLIKNDPQMVVVPNSNDEEDIEAANMGTKALKHFWRNKRMKKKRRELAGWIYATGNGFLDHRWNPNMGPMTLDSESGNLVYEGDVDSGVWSPFEVIVPAQFLGDTEVHTMPWLMKMKWRSLDYIAKMYPKKKDELSSEQQPQNIAGVNLIMQSTPSIGQKIEGANLINFYVQPNETFPKGLFVAAANGTILEQSEYPFDYYNIEHFKDIDLPGLFWGKATSAEALSLQTRWNRINNSVDEFNDVSAKGKMLAPRRSNLEVVLDDNHGEVVKYTPVMGHKPEWMTLKGLPATYDLALTLTQQSFQKLYSQHEVTQGTNKSDLRSGLMVDLLLEQDAHGNIPSHAVFEESLEAYGSRVLERIQAGYKNERFLKIVGKDGEFEILSFKGADLRGNTDVSVKRQSSLPDSRAAREARIMERYGQGLYGDPNDPEVRRHVMNMLDDAVVKDIYGHTRLDESYARYENELLASGQVTKLIVNNYDDHRVHLQEHERFQKDMKYQRLKTEKPEIFGQLEAMFASHNMQHQEFIKQQEEALLEREAKLKNMAKGGE